MVLENYQNLGETKALSLIAAYGFGAKKGLQKEIDEIRNMGIDFGGSSVRRGYVVQLFQLKGIFDEFCQMHWSNYQTKEGKRLSRWYLKKSEEYQRYLERGERIEDAEEDEEKEVSEFVYESDLRDFLGEHLDKLEKGLILYKDEQGRAGLEYPVENGRIDILARDSKGGFLVLELKVSQGRSKTLGQLLYYKGWVERNLAHGNNVRGVIVAKEVPEDLKLACSQAKDVTLYEYDLQVSLRPILLV